MSPKLSRETQRRVDMMYSPEQREEVTRLLGEQCGHNIPGTRPDWDEVAFEQLRFSVLKVSRGDIEALKKAITLAKIDFRDVIIWAGFASSTGEHKKWLPTGIGERPY